MQLQTFPNGNKSDGRWIDVVIELHFISFYFKNQKDYFYSFLKDDWDIKMIVHMRLKRWFTPEMENYINQHTI
jgi:hypothetical protein